MHRSTRPRTATARSPPSCSTGAPPRRRRRCRPTAARSPSSCRRSTSPPTARSRASGWPAPTATRRRSPPAHATPSRRGRPTAARSRSRPVAARRTATPRSTCCPSSAPARCAPWRRCRDGIADLAWSPDGRWLGFTSRTRDARYDADDERAQPPRKIETFFTRLDNVGWIVDRPTHVYVAPADATTPPRNLTPGPFQHHGVAWLGDSSGIVTAAQRHEGWDLDLAEDLYVVPLDGEVRRPHGAAPACTSSRRCRRTAPTVAFLGFDDTSIDPQNISVGVIPVAGGAHRWISDGLDRTFYPSGGARPPVWLDDDTVIATAEDRGDTHLFRLAVGDGVRPRTADQRADRASSASTPPADGSPPPRPPSTTRRRSSRSTVP